MGSSGSSAGSLCRSSHSWRTGLRGAGCCADAADAVRREAVAAHERAGEIFSALGNVIGPQAVEDRLRVTPGLRASDEVWLPVELAGERLADAVAGIASAVERLAARGAQAVVLGCTEIPIGLPHSRRSSLPVPLVDTIDALARASIAWARS